MLICVDIGNTNTKFGVFDGSPDALVCSFSISTTNKRTSDEYALLIKQLLLDNSVCAMPDCFCISSVVPSVTSDISAALYKICNNDPFIISTGTRTGYPIRIDVQSQLGADIVSNTAAALNIVKPPFVVVDVGTATTVTAVDSDGALIGTVIAPGASISVDALNNSAALLTEIPFNKPDTVIGKNSQDSIRSGAFYGHVYMIDGFVRQIREEICKNGEKLGLVGTGGLASKLLPSCRNKFIIDPYLTLKGAASLFYLNTMSRNYTK